jgi:hypothetical protein
MTAATSRGLAGNSGTTRDEVARVVGGRGWRGGEKREGTAWRPASEPRDTLIPVRATQVTAFLAPGVTRDEGPC